MYILTRYPLTVYLFKFRIISRDISQSSRISKKSKFKRDYYKFESMLSAPFRSTIAPHINVSGLSCCFELVSWRKIPPPTWIVHSAEFSAQSIANFGNVDAKCGLVNSAESSAQYCADLLLNMNLELWVWNWNSQIVFSLSRDIINFVGISCSGVSIGGAFYMLYWQRSFEWPCDWSP